MRQLAHIEKITAINPIVGADLIEVATVLGWECVVAKKDNFKIGDLVIYIEVDSIVPEKPEYEFLRARKFRVRTIKLKKQVSQGLILPLSMLENKVSITEGKDVTDILGIIKYDPEVQSEIENEVSGKKSKLHKFLLRYKWYRALQKKSDSWPSWISKSDEERLQAMPSVVEKFKDKILYATEKIDYQSVTFFTKTKYYFHGLFKKKEFGVCSRNKKVVNKNSLYWKIAEKYDLERIMKAYPNDLTIQGEQGDSKVQGNKYKITEPKMWIYTIIKDQDGEKYHFNYDEMKSFISFSGSNLELVPLIDNNFKMLPTVKEMIEYAKGKSVVNNSKINREGVVFRCIENGKKVLSFKCINPDFLLEHNE